MPQSEYELERIRNVVLPTVLVQEITTPPDDWECSICMENTPENRICKLNCGHIFHFDCADRWTRTVKGNCPLCRTRVL